MRGEFAHLHIRSGFSFGLGVAAPAGLVGEVAVEDLVRKLQVPLVGELLDVAPEDGLVLFCGHAVPPSPIPLALGRAVAPL